MKPNFNDKYKPKESSNVHEQKEPQAGNLTRRVFTEASRIPPQKTIEKNIKREVGDINYDNLVKWLRTQGKVIESTPQQEIIYTIPEVNETRNDLNKIISEYKDLKKSTQHLPASKENMKNRLNRLEKMQDSIEIYLQKATKLFGDLSMTQNEASSDSYTIELEQNIEITRRNYKSVKEESNQIFSKRSDIALIYKDSNSLVGRAARESIGFNTLKEWHTAQNNIEQDKKSQNYQLLSSGDQHSYKTTYQELLETGDEFHKEYMNWSERQNIDNKDNIRVPNKTIRSINEAINNLDRNTRDLQTLGDELKSSMDKAQETNESVCKLADALIEIDTTEGTLENYDRRNGTDLWSKFGRRRLNDHERNLIYTYLATKGLEETTLSRLRSVVNSKIGRPERSTRLQSPGGTVYDISPGQNERRRFAQEQGLTRQQLSRLTRGNASMSRQWRRTDEDS